MQHLLDPFVLKRLHKSRRIADFRILLWVHDVSAHPGESKIINRFLMRYALKYADVFVVLSNNVMNRLKLQTNKPIIKINHPVEKNIQTKNLNSEYLESDALFYGRLVKYKGLERLAKSWELFQKQYPDFKLLIAGTGNEKLINRYFRNIDGIRIKLGYLADAEIESLLYNTKLVLLPYDEASQSGVIAQAVQFKKPYIVTPISGLKEQADIFGGGLIVRDMTPEAFAEGIKAILLDEEFPKEVSKDISWNSQILSLKSQLEDI